MVVAWLNKWYPGFMVASLKPSWKMNYIHHSTVDGGMMGSQSEVDSYQKNKRTKVIKGRVFTQMQYGFYFDYKEG